MDGFVYVAFGAGAEREAAASIGSLRRFHQESVIVVSDNDEGRIPSADYFLRSKTTGLADDVQRSRWAKVNLDALPLDRACYLDADTRVQGDLSAGFEVLGDGWDLVITPSDHQAQEVMWHVDEGEREATLDALACVPLALQGGVFFWRKNERTRAFFRAWREEWLRWKGQDQGALLRALWRAPLRVWVLGRPFNGGSVVQHRFGACLR